MSLDTSLSLFPPLLLRLAGGTGGIWLDITEILTLMIGMNSDGYGYDVQLLLEAIGLPIRA
ncbi:MAG TPA: hypothetical protein VGU90_05355 [Terriglobales bacterium]|nr:hypothetical protein [Terriglobales bacterium]